MQINREIEVFRAEAADERDVGADALQAADAGRHDHVVQVWIVPDDRRGGLLDHVREAGRRIRALQGADQGRGENDVADEAEAQQQNRARCYGSIVASSISITGMSSLI